MRKSIHSSLFDSVTQIFASFGIQAVVRASPKHYELLKWNFWQGQRVSAASLTVLRQYQAFSLVVSNRGRYYSSSFATGFGTGTLGQNAGFQKPCLFHFEH